jgi:hypothetical protein
MQYDRGGCREFQEIPVTPVKQERYIARFGRIQRRYVRDQAPLVTVERRSDIPRKIA